MAKAKSYKPDGVHTITPYLVVAGAAEAIEFYKKAFGATQIMRMMGPNGQVMHAEMQIGDSHFYLTDEYPDMGARGPKAIGGTSVTLHMYVSDCDAIFNQATAAGAKAKRPPADMFWGDRYGELEDPYGHKWGIATAKETLTQEEMMERAKREMAAQSQK